MTFHILVLCRANVCRSPLMAAALERLLAAECRTGEVVVRSAGVDAVPGEPACATMGGLARAAGLDTAAWQRHRSTMLSDAMVAEADLVLAADRRVRSQLIRRSGSRIGERVFTLREAGQLAASAAEHPVRRGSSGQTGQPRPAGSGASDLSERLRAATAAMHARRGLADLPGTDRFIPLTRPWRPMTLSTQDVPDAHGAPAAPHRVVHRLTVVSTVQLVHAMVIDHPEETR